MDSTMDDQSRIKSRRKPLSELEDNELQTEVLSLRNNVERKEAELRDVSALIKDAQDAVEQEYQNRRRMAGRLLQAEEATPLVTETRQVRRELERTRQRLQQLQERRIREKRELDELKRQLEETEWHQGDSGDTGNSLTVSVQLEGRHREVREKCLLTEKQLESAERELQAWRTRKEATTPSLDQQLDRLVQHCCERAGLRLIRHQS